MYLLRLEQADNVSLVKCDGNNIPQYAVLSHTWLADHEEVNFQDLQHTISPILANETYPRRPHAISDSVKKRPGYQKIIFCGERAAHHHLQYFWVDTCCIDKTSSAELAEAINSMFRWYQFAARCYVFLSDVSARTANDLDQQVFGKDDWISSFKRSRWFMRGWTLQELIAPRVVDFFSRDGMHLGDKYTLKDDIVERTNLPVAVLEGAPLSWFGGEERLSWAQGRQTRREEDEAYSLLGICNVYIPLIYGEGRESAMKRLRKSIQELEEEAEMDQEHGSWQLRSIKPRKRSIHDLDDSPDDEKPYKELQLRGSKRPHWLPQGYSFNQEREHLTRLLQSLQFKQINTRQLTIEDAHSKTCAWLLEKSEYLDWIDRAKVDEHHGILWIKGHPGTGKSTIMKYILHHTLEEYRGFGPRHSPEAAKRQVVVAFFFNARGETLEKSTSGMYRSLLAQLLNFRPFLGPKFLRMVDPEALNAREGFEWDAATIQRMFEIAVLSIKEGVTCFVDALDECEEEEVRNMLKFFDHVRQIATTNGTEFRICLASRHYPHITIYSGLELVLEAQEGHVQDINEYLESELRIGDGKVADDIRTRVQKKASGIFMWVVLVVKLLNKEYDRGRIQTLQRRLEEIPGDLHDLLRDILMRDTNNTGELILCIQWILFTVFPLRPEQLYFAVLTGADPDAPAEWDRGETNFDTIRRLILDCSKGLAEITMSLHHTVQFIHESVRDFLLKEENLGKLWPELGNDFQKQSYDALHRSSVRYISLSVLAQVKKQEQLGRERPLDLNCMALPQFPFLAHAVTNVLHYGALATKHGLFEEAFSWDPAQKITETGSKVSQAAGAACQLAQRTSTLYVIMDVTDPGPICFVYISADGRKTINAYTKDRNASPDTGLVRVLRHDQDILPYLVELGNERIFASMLATGKFDVNKAGKDNETSLTKAVSSKRVTIMKAILDAGADVVPEQGREIFQLLRDAKSQKTEGSCI
jgi:hypothetical protein